MSNESTRIFILEDETIVALDMADTLVAAGFEVVGPSIRLGSAIEIVRKSDFDAAILDVNLGQGRTSRPVAEILKDRGIPYAFSTAYDTDQVEFIGPEDIVAQKPLSQKDLLDVLRRLLPSERMPAEA